MTPNQQTLLDLATRAEGVAGADRELDALIWLTCVPGATRKESRYTHKASGRKCVIDETRENGRLIVVPHYTASLDAVMSLIEPDEYWRLGNDGEGADVDMFKATVTSHDEIADLHFHDAVAATPALALTAAALRARAAICGS